MPAPLSSPVYWVSFMSFLALRRESFVRFLEDTPKLRFDKRYVDLFFNELVCLNVGIIHHLFIVADRWIVGNTVGDSLDGPGNPRHASATRGDLLQRLFDWNYHEVVGSLRFGSGCVGSADSGLLSGRFNSGYLLRPRWTCRQLVVHPRDTDFQFCRTAMGEGVVGDIRRSHPAIRGANSAGGGSNSSGYRSEASSRHRQNRGDDSGHAREFRAH